MLKSFRLDLFGCSWSRLWRRFKYLKILPKDSLFHNSLFRSGVYLCSAWITGSNTDLRQNILVEENSIELVDEKSKLNQPSLQRQEKTKLCTKRKCFILEVKKGKVLKLCMYKCVQPKRLESYFMKQNADIQEGIL